MWIHVRIYLELTRRLLQSALAEHDPAGAGGAPGLGRTSSANGKSTGVLCSFSGGVHRSRPTAHPRPPRPRSRRRCQSSAARGLDAADRHPEVVTADGLEFVSHGHTENASTRCGPRRAGLPKEKAPLLVALKMLAEWTGVEPATPGVTDRAALHRAHASHQALAARPSC